MTTERERRKAQERLFLSGDYAAIIASLVARIRALEAHTGYTPPPQDVERTKELEAAVRRLENAQDVIAEALEERPPAPEPKPIVEDIQPAPVAPPPPEPEIPDGYADLARDNEAWGDAEKRLAVELAELRNKLIGGYINDTERAFLKRLEKLFARSKKIAVDSVL